jgi:multisubunit Na+/H+ antiporter MnhC subunit
MVLAKPASLPPIVMLTSVVLGLSAETWLLRTSAVVAPEQATETKEVGELAAAHCSG